MEKYPKSFTFPIQMFNAFSSTPEFGNFNGYFEHFKSLQRETKFNFQNLPNYEYLSELGLKNKLEASHIFLLKSSVLFPYIFFVDEKIYEEEYFLDKLTKNPFVRDGKELMNLFSIRIDQKKINKTLSDIQNLDYVNFNYTVFIDNLFECLYKYASYKLMDFVYTGGSDSMTYKKLLLDFIELKISEVDNSKLVNQNEFLKYNRSDIIKNIDKSFRTAKYNAEKLNVHIEFLSSNSNFIMWLYSIIDNNIRYSKELSQNKKNKIIRPLFHQLIGRFSDKNWQELDTHDPKFVSAQRDVIHRYNKKFC